MLRIVRTVLCGWAVILVAGCKSGATASPTAPPSSAYPAPQLYPYPAPTQIISPEASSSAYPGPLGTRSPVPGVVPFQIDRPVKAGEAVVTGRGPAGIPVVIAAVTTMGNELGAGVIGPDNRFTITVPSLVAGIRIGLGVGDLSGTGHAYEDFYGDEYKGEGALLVPQVGYYQDTVMVEP